MKKTVMDGLGQGCGSVRSARPVSIAALLVVLLLPVPIPAQQVDQGSPSPELLGDGPPGETSVLLWRLVSLGVEPGTSVRVEAVLRESIDGLAGFRLIPEASLEVARADDPNLDECASAQVCAAAMGRALGADFVLLGVLSALGDARSLELRRVDAGNGEVIERLSRSWTGDDDSLLQAIREAALTLLDPGALFGSLDLRVNEAGIRVFLDGEELGVTPVPPVPLSPGRHTLKLVSPFHHALERFVDVPMGQTVTVEVTLESLKEEAFVEARPSIGGLTLALKGGLATNLGVMTGPTFQVEGAWRLPYWGGRIGLGAEFGGRVALNGALAVLPAGEELHVATRLFVVPVHAQISFFPLPTYPFSPYLIGGVGAALVSQHQRVDGLQGWESRELVPAFNAGIGLVYALGTGDVLIEAGFQGLRIDGLRPVSPIQGLVVTGGYRFSTSRRAGVSRPVSSESAPMARGEVGS